MQKPLLLIFLPLLASAADPDGFGMWKVSDFKQHESVLNQKVGPDHSARETLGDYGNHLVRMIHRAATGAPEFHENFVDLWIVTSGSGTMVVGGTLTDARATGGRGEMTGTGIEGGERHAVEAGDVMHIPAKTAHQIQVDKGGQITYLRVAIPAR
jgi:mannose-6-phosphate isomerase-like protein (cupin superfamily)